MSDAVAVIGAGYGDEGKGLVTDSLSSPATRVVRFNGGAQAAHTVCTPDRKRHVFHHFGSGTLAGASTHLSKHFVANPIFALRELKTLPKFALTVDPRCAVTVPLDMMINQEIELQRDLRRPGLGGRHGTCGIGFGETVERTQFGPALAVKDLNRDYIRFILDRVATEWAPERCETVGIDFERLPYSPVIDDQFVDDCIRFRAAGDLLFDSDLADGVDRVVFEGAQGLGLDQDLGHFPHVTRSNTGLTNVLELAEDAGISWLRTVYVTRAYATRHGAGPLSREDEWDFGKFDDPTNEPNEWQGRLRFARLDMDERRGWLERDVFHNLYRRATDRTHGLVVTCVDQMPTLNPETLATAYRLPLWGVSRGPRRDDLEWKKASGTHVTSECR